MPNKKAPQIDTGATQTFAVRLRNARLNNGYTQKALAEELSRRLGTTITSMSISAYEARNIKPRFVVAQALADILSVPVDFLLGTTDQFVDTKATLSELYEIKGEDLYYYAGAPLYCVPPGAKMEKGYWVLVNAEKGSLVSIREVRHISDFERGTRFFTRTPK